MVHIMLPLVNPPIMNDIYVLLHANHAYSITPDIYVTQIIYCLVHQKLSYKEFNFNILLV